MGYRTAAMNIAHKLKSKRSAKIGVLILMGGMLAVLTEAQFKPIEATVIRVIDGDTIRGPGARQGPHRPSHRRGHPRDGTPDQDRAALWSGGQRLHQGRA